MKAIIDHRPFPVCILRSGPARDHSPSDVAETFKRNMPPIQYRPDDYDLVEQTAHLDMMMEFQK